jgi:hypothetical protein
MAGGGAVLYAPATDGDFGGDAYCEATFGAGYVMANMGEIAAYTHIVPNNIQLWASYPSPNYCNNWTTNDHTEYGYTIKFLWTAATNGGYLQLGLDYQECDSNFQVPCIKR